MSNKPQAKYLPYSGRIKTDSRGTKHYHVYVPSERDFAWIEITDYLDNRDFVDQILDPGYLPEWKIWWLDDAYQRFRERENARKRKDTSHSAWAREPWDETQEQRGAVSLPEIYTLRREEEEQAERVVAEITSILTSEQSHYMTLALGEEKTYVGIAREELPGATQAEVNKRADAIRKCVARGKAQILKKFGQTRPDSSHIKDV